jgi:hypothetical protein
MSPGEIAAAAECQGQSPAELTLRVGPSLSRRQTRNDRRPCDRQRTRTKRRHVGQMIQNGVVRSSDNDAMKALQRGFA